MTSLNKEKNRKISPWEEEIISLNKGKAKATSLPEEENVFETLPQIEELSEEEISQQERLDLERAIRESKSFVSMKDFNSQGGPSSASSSKPSGAEYPTQGGAAEQPSAVLQRNMSPAGETPLTEAEASALVDAENERLIAVLEEQYQKLLENIKANNELRENISTEVLKSARSSAETNLVSSKEHKASSLSYVLSAEQKAKTDAAAGMVLKKLFEVLPEGDSAEKTGRRAFVNAHFSSLAAFHSVSGRISSEDNNPKYTDPENTPYFTSVARIIKTRVDAIETELRKASFTGGWNENPGIIKQTYEAAKGIFDDTASDTVVNALQKSWADLLILVCSISKDEEAIAILNYKITELEETISVLQNDKEIKQHQQSIAELKKELEIRKENLSKTTGGLTQIEEKKLKKTEKPSLLGTYIHPEYEFEEPSMFQKAAIIRNPKKPDYDPMKLKGPFLVRDLLEDFENLLFNESEPNTKNFETFLDLFFTSDPNHKTLLKKNTAARAFFKVSLSLVFFENYIAPITETLASTTGSFISISNGVLAGTAEETLKTQNRLEAAKAKLAEIPAEKKEQRGDLEIEIAALEKTSTSLSKSEVQHKSIIERYKPMHDELQETTRHIKSFFEKQRVSILKSQRAADLASATTRLVTATASLFGSWGALGGLVGGSVGQLITSGLENKEIYDLRLSYNSQEILRRAAGSMVTLEHKFISKYMAYVQASFFSIMMEQATKDQLNFDRSTTIYNALITEDQNYESALTNKNDTYRFQLEKIAKGLKDTDGAIKLTIDKANETAATFKKELSKLIKERDNLEKKNKIIDTEAQLQLDAKNKEIADLLNNYQAKEKKLKEESEAKEKKLKEESEAKEKKLKEESEAKEKKLKEESEAKEKKLKEESEAKEKKLKEESEAKEKKLKEESEAKEAKLLAAAKKGKDKLKKKLKKEKEDFDAQIKEKNSILGSKDSTINEKNAALLELKQLADEKIEELQNLQASIDNLNTSLIVKEDNIRDLTASIENKEADYNSLSKTNASLENELKSAKANLAIKHKEIEDATAYKEELTQSISSLQKSYAAYVDGSSKSNAALRNVTESVSWEARQLYEPVIQSLDKNKADLEFLYTQLSTRYAQESLENNKNNRKSLDKIKNLESEIRALEDRVENKNWEIDLLKKARYDLNKTIKNEYVPLETHTRKIDILNSTIASKERGLNSEKARLERQENFLRSEIDKYASLWKTAEDTALKEKSAAIEEITAEKDTEIKNLKDEKDTEIKNLKDEKDTEIKNLKDEKDTEIKNLKDEKDTEIKNLKDEKDTEIKNLKDEKDTEIKNLKDESFNQLQSLTAWGFAKEAAAKHAGDVALNKERDDHINAMKAADERYLRAVSAEIDHVTANFTKDMTEIQNNLFKLETEKKIMDANYAQDEEAIANLNSKIAELEETISSLQNDKLNLSSNYHSTKTASEFKDRELEQHQQSIAELKKELEIQKENLSKTTEDLQSKNDIIREKTSEYEKLAEYKKQRELGDAEEKRKMFGESIKKANDDFWAAKSKRVNYLWGTAAWLGVKVSRTLQQTGFLPSFWGEKIETAAETITANHFISGLFGDGLAGSLYEVTIILATLLTTWTSYWFLRATKIIEPKTTDFLKAEILDLKKKHRNPTCGF